jgi:hypothetical protein
MFCDAPLILTCDSFLLYIAIADFFEMGSAYSRDYYSPGPARGPAPDVSICLVSFGYHSICLIFWLISHVMQQYGRATFRPHYRGRHLGFRGGRSAGGGLRGYYY